MTVQVAEPAGGSDVGSQVPTAIFFCAEMPRCVLKTASLFDCDLVFGREV